MLKNNYYFILIININVTNVWNNIYTICNLNQGLGAFGYSGSGSGLGSEKNKCNDFGSRK